MARLHLFAIFALIAAGLTFNANGQDSRYLVVPVDTTTETVIYRIPDLAISLGNQELVEVFQRLPECQEWFVDSKSGKPRFQCKTTQEFIIQYLQATVDPESWRAKGGVGTIEFQTKDHQLVVFQSKTNQDRVAATLESFRRVMDVEVALECRIVCLPSTNGENLVDLLDFDEFDGKLAFLTQKQLHAWLNLAVNNKQVDFIQAPKVTGFNGQDLTISVGAEMELLSSDRIKEGVFLKLLPVVSADRLKVPLGCRRLAK